MQHPLKEGPNNDKWRTLPEICMMLHMEHTGSGDVDAVAKERCGVVEQAEPSEEPIEAAIGRVRVERGREVGTRVQSRHVWVRIHDVRDRGILAGHWGRCDVSGQVWVRRPGERHALRARRLSALLGLACAPTRPHTSGAPHGTPEGRV